MDENDFNARVKAIVDLQEQKRETIGKTGMPMEGYREERRGHRTNIVSTHERVTHDLRTKEGIEGIHLYFGVMAERWRRRGNVTIADLAEDYRRVADVTYEKFGLPTGHRFYTWPFHAEKHDWAAYVGAETDKGEAMKSNMETNSGFCSSDSFIALLKAPIHDELKAASELHSAANMFESFGLGVAEAIKQGQVPNLGLFAEYAISTQEKYQVLYDMTAILRESVVDGKVEGGLTVSGAVLSRIAQKQKNVPRGKALGASKQDAKAENVRLALEIVEPFLLESKRTKDATIEQLQRQWKLKDNMKPTSLSYATAERYLDVLRDNLLIKKWI